MIRRGWPVVEPWQSQHRFTLFGELEIKVADVAKGVPTEGDVGDPEVGSPVLIVCSILGIRPGFFLGLSRGRLRAESTDDGSVGVRIPSAVEGQRTNCC